MDGVSNGTESIGKFMSSRSPGPFPERGTSKGVGGRSRQTALGNEPRGRG